MKYNILFSDLDGTLLKTDKTISPETKKALDSFVDAGGRLVLTSGRPPESILEVAQKLGILYKGSYIIAYNGAMIYDCDKRKVIHKEVISREDVSLIEEKAQSYNLHIHTYEDDQVVSHTKDAEILFYTTYVHMDIKYVKDFGKELKEEPMKMIAIDLHDHGLLNIFQEAIQPLLKDRVQVLFSTPHYLEFLPVNAGKGNAVKKLCEILNISLDQAIAIGDEENDISMIRTAGLGIAMKNGNFKTIEAADLVTEKTNDEDAFVDLINQILTDEVPYDFRNRLFHEDNMFTRMRAFALSENLTETFRALNYMRECHLGQFRKPNKFSTEQILYINHPLLMACQAHALGLRDDALLASILLHDVVEDTDVLAKDLPFSAEVKEIVDLVSFVVPKGISKADWKKIYYEKIKSNKKACVVKVLDRCNNVSTMAGSFSKSKLQEYITETEEYVFPLLSELKNNYPEYNDIAFLIKYQLLSLLETIKYLL